MATYSTVLGLKLNQLGDPFELSDFTANWGILDASPGTFICTSVSRPSWGTAQAGRMIFMTDLKQLSYWTGTAWADLRDSAPTFAGGTVVNVSCNPGSTGIFNVLTFTTPRPSAMALFVSASYRWQNNKVQGLYQTVAFDGVTQPMGYPESVRLPGTAGDDGSDAGTNATSVAVIPSVAAGQHKIGLQVNIWSSYNVPVKLTGVKAIGLISLYSTGNTL